jgi:aminoglycoside phosphotransferase (APT) family kinase protein
MLLDLEKEQISDVVKPFLRSLDPVSSITPAELVYTPLKGGSKASLYRFDINLQPYVLRLLPPRTPEYKRESQIALAKQAGVIGVGPKVLFVDADMQAFIMEYIEGRQSESDDFKTPEMLVAFAQFLRVLHRSQAPFPVAVTPFQRW